MNLFEVFDTPLFHLTAGSLIKTTFVILEIKFISTL